MPTFWHLFPHFGIQGTRNCQISDIHILINAYVIYGCPLERETTKVRPDCIYEPECHWEPSEPIDEKQCKNVTTPICNMVLDNVCEQIYHTQYENQCVEKLEQKCETK